MLKHLGCTSAHSADQYHGWRCDITDGACVFLIPNSRACAKMFGEGPDAEAYFNGEFDKEE